MSSTNKTTYYDLSQYVGSDKPTYLGDYNSDMLKIDTGLHTAADAADTALTTANAANSAATSASTTASTALSTAQSASNTASQAQTTAETALTNSGAAQTAAEEAETAARANTITNLAPAYDPSLTYAVDDLVTYIDAQGTGKIYKCIVAVTTPEAFNINKWDDVTASEVFASKYELINTFTSVLTDTWGDMIKALCNFDSREYKDLKIVLNTATSPAEIVFNLAGHTADFNKFSYVGGGFAGNIDITYLACYIGSTPTGVVSRIAGDSNGVTFTNITDVVLNSSASMTFKIYGSK